MAREKEGYRDMLELLMTAYPGRTSLNVAEAAAALGLHRTTVTAAITRHYDPLPAQVVGEGKQRKSYLIPITGLARWSVARR